METPYLKDYHFRMSIKVDHVKSYLHNAPFKPFDIRTSDGRVYRIDHPEFLFISRDPNVIYFEIEDGRSITMALSQVATLEIANSHAA